jgi:hypothetical protein
MAGGRHGFAVELSSARWVLAACLFPDFERRDGTPTFKVVQATAAVTKNVASGDFKACP